MRESIDRTIFERCVAHVTLRPNDFSMKDRIEAHVVEGGTVQVHLITVTYTPTRTSRAYRSAFPSAWSGQFRKDLDDGVFY